MKHSITQIPKALTQKALATFKLVTNYSEIPEKAEIFKIRDGKIIGVDYVNNETSKRFIKSEISLKIIYLKIK